MKIAIASEDKSTGSNVSMQAGRAPYFQIVEDGKISEVISNPFAIGGGGAGPSVTRMLNGMGVKKIIAGRIGPNMQGALDQVGMQVEQTQGKVSDYIQD